MRFLAADGAVKRDFGRFPEPAQRVVLDHFLARGEHELERRRIDDIDPHSPVKRLFDFAQGGKSGSDRHAVEIDPGGMDCLHGTVMEDADTTAFPFLDLVGAGQKVLVRKLRALEMNGEREILGREAQRGTIRLHHGLGGRAAETGTGWYVTDYQTKPLLACWINGSVTFAMTVDRVADAYEPVPCLGQRPSVPSRRVCLLHFGALKRWPAVARLPHPLPAAAERSLALAAEVTLTRDGMWLPGPAGEGSWMLVSGLSSRLQLFKPDEVAAYVGILEGRGARPKGAGRVGNPDR